MDKSTTNAVKCAIAIDSNNGLPYVDILNVKIHRINMANALKLAETFLGSDKPHIIVTADSYSVAVAQKDLQFKEILASADLVTPDGSGVLLAAKMLGYPLEGRVSGVDMVDHLCKIAADKSIPVFFLGAAPGIAAEAAEKLCETHNGLIVAGVQHGFFREEDETQICQKIKESGAKLLFVAMGIPKQEKWIAKNIHNTGVSLAMGVGGSLDVISGKIKRAPQWMQDHGLEWAYRLSKDRKKFSKVAVLPGFFLQVICQKIKQSVKG